MLGGLTKLAEREGRTQTPNGILGNFCYYADKEKNEIDFLIECAGKLHPIEIKKATSIRSSRFIGPGCVLCFHNKYLPFGEGVESVPVGYL